MEVEKPEDANAQCVGPSSTEAGKASGCAGCPNQQACASGAASAPDPAAEHIVNRMSIIKHKILVLSGKGGVGKSTLSAQISFELARRGFQVGLLDVDICGPSIPRMLGVAGHEVHQSASGWSPVYVDDNLGVMSIGFMLPSTDDAIIWRGPRKNGLIKQFLTDVVWNELDYLIVDTPPGTSDEHISIVQYLKASEIDGAVVVTTPQEVAMADVRKELNFCKKTGIKVLGVVENMTDIVVPMASIDCVLNAETQGLRARWVNSSGENVSEDVMTKILAAVPEIRDLHIEFPLFTPAHSAAAGAGAVPVSSMCPEGMAAAFGVPFLGKLPMDPNVMNACENGVSFMETFPHSPAAFRLGAIVDKLVAATTSVTDPRDESIPMTV